MIELLDDIWAGEVIDLKHDPQMISPDRQQCNCIGACEQ